MGFTCYYIINRSFISENTVHVQMSLWLRCIPHTGYGNSIAIERVIIKGILYRQIRADMVNKT